MLRILVTNQTTGAQFGGSFDTQAQADAWLADPNNARPDVHGGPGIAQVVYADVTEELKRLAIDAVQDRLDALAQSWGYDDIKSGATYKGDPYARFNAEGSVMFEWRSATWAAVDANKDAPSIEALFAALPPIPTRPGA